MLHFCDGFDSYTETADLVKHKWHRYNLYTDPQAPSVDNMGDWQWNAVEGVKGGGCLKHSGPSIGDQMGTQFSYRPKEWSGLPQYSTLFWFKISERPATREKLCDWTQVDSNGYFAVSMTLYVDTEGHLSFEIPRFEAFVGRFPEILYETFFDVCDNEWHCLELKIDLSTGTYQNPQPQTFRLGLDDFVLSDKEFDINVQSAGAKVIAFYSLGVPMWIDDVIVWDEAGDSPVEMPWGDMTDTRADEFIWDSYNNKPVNGDLNNFPERGQDDFFYWMGSRQITTLRPASDGTINDFDLVGAATKLDAVDDAMPDLTKYLEQNQPGARMLFNLDEFQYDLPVYSVVVNTLNVMADLGSVVTHAEALVAPDFELGIRRRVSGRYELLSTGTNLVPNGGPDFVDATGWTAHDLVTVGVENGKLKLVNSSEDHADPDPFVEIAVPVTPNRFYRVSAQRSALGETDPSGSLQVRGGTISGSQNNSIDSMPISSSSTEPTINTETWYIPSYVSTLYLQIFPPARTQGDYYIDWVSVEELVPEFDFKYYQWAFRYNPATDLEWDQASINAAEFGMRIAL